MIYDKFGFCPNLSYVFCLKKCKKLFITKNIAQRIKKALCRCLLCAKKALPLRPKSVVYGKE